METLDLPTIDETLVATAPAAVAPAAPPTAIATSIDAVRTEVAKLDPIKAGLADLQQRHPPRAIIAAIDTPKGLALAEESWRAWRNPRLAVEKARKAAKAPLLALGRAVDAFAGELEDTLRAGEDHYKAQITAEEDRRAAAKAEADRIEAERVAAHQAGIATIRAYVARCQQPGMTAERISRGIAQLEDMIFHPEQWEEFAVPAAHAQTETLSAMRVLLLDAQVREAQAAEIERLRALAEAQAALLAQAAERERLEREAAEAEAQRQRDIEAEAQRIREAEARALAQHAERQAAIEAGVKSMLAAMPQPPEQKASEQGYTERRDAQQVLKAEPATADATDRDDPANSSPRVGAMGVGQPADAGPAGDVPVTQAELIERGRSIVNDIIAAEIVSDAIRANEPATLNLGTISGRLGFTVNAAFLADVLRISPAATDKRALLFRESQFPVICRGIASHASAMAELYAVQA